MDGLARLARDYVETSLGKIFTYPIRYLFTELAPKRAKLCIRWDHKEFDERIDEDGRAFRLYRGKSVQCPHPDKWQGIYPRLDHKRQYHPDLKDCKTCEFHEVKRIGRNFACCRWYRENNQRPTVAALVTDAVHQAEAMVRGKS